MDRRLQAGKLQLAENTSWTMMHSREFQAWKCKFGDGDTDEVSKFPVTVPLLNERFSNIDAGIEGGKMMFS